MRTKKIFSILVILILVFTGNRQTFAAQSSIPVYIDGVKVALSSDQQPYVNKENRTMISIRGLSEYLGYTVQWNAQNKTVVITHKGNTIKLMINSKTVLVNGKSVGIDASTESSKGRIFVPLRFVSQTFGSTVSYDSKAKAVIIKEKEIANLTNATMYTVQLGDTLYSISQEFNVTIADVKGWNNLTSETLKTGQKLKIIKKVMHTVVSGDTLYQLASNYKVTVDAIKKENNLTGSTLVVGQELTIPTSSSPSTEKPVVEPKVEKATVKLENGTLNVRTGPSTNYGIITGISNGTVVEVIGVSGDWKKIVYGTKTGWVNSDFLVMGIINETPVVSTGSLKGKIIVLDPGHGGNDSGAVGIDGNTYEKTLALAYSKDIRTRLQELGATVYMTRTTDLRCTGTWSTDTNTDLKCRTDFANTKKADIYISVHFNSAYGATGTETFYNSTVYNRQVNPYPTQSKRLAQLVHKYYRASVNLPDRGVKNANYYVNRNAKMPSILLEVGFMSNTTDLNRVKLNTVQKAVANSVAKGVQEYFSK